MTWNVFGRMLNLVQSNLIFACVLALLYTWSLILFYYVYDYIINK